MSHSADRQRVTISFYGGEPLLNFDLIRDCIEYAERTVSGAKLLMLLMTSNGTALSSERAAFLAAHSVRIMVSIDGPAAMHDRYRPFTGGRGSFNAIAKNLLRLREMAPEYYESCITFNVVLAPPYDMEKVLEFINSGEIIGPKQGVRMTYASGRDTTFYSRFTEDELAADGGRAGMWQRYESAAVCGQFNGEPAPEHRALHALFNQGLAGVYLRTLSRRMPRYYHPGGICVPGVRRLFTTVDGRFFVCEKGNTTTETLQIGDVDSGVDVDRVWEMIRTYSALTAVDCRNCWANRLCNNCFVLAERGGRFDKQDKQMSCAIIRSQVHTNMVRMCDILSKNPQGLKFMDDMTFT